MLALSKFYLLLFCIFKYITVNLDIKVGMTLCNFDRKDIFESLIQICVVFDRLNIHVQEYMFSQ